MEKLLDAGKIAGVAAIVGTVLAVFLSPEQAQSVANSSSTVQMIAVAVAAGAGAFGAALLKKKQA